MSEEEVTQGKVVVASAGMILYRWPPGGGIEILVGRRGNEPWRGSYSVVFGGLMKGTDESALQTAMREAMEETSHGLKILPKYPYPIGIFGPKNFHHLLAIDEKTGDPKAIKTENAISKKYKFLLVVFAGLVTGGAPIGNDEAYNFRWVEPVEFAKEEPPCAFQQALALEMFYKMYKYSDNLRNPRILGYLATPSIT